MQHPVPVPQPPEEELPFLANTIPPQTGLSRTKVLTLVGITVGIVFVSVWLVLSQRAAATATAPQPARQQPGPSDVPLDHYLQRMSTSYAGVNRQPPPAEKPPVDAPVPDPMPPPLPIVWKTPTPAATAPVTTPLVQQTAQIQQAVPPPKEPPKRWLFADVQNTVAKPPFPKPEGKVTQSGGRGAGEKEATLLHQAHWTKPSDPTRVLYRSQGIPGTLLHELNSDIPGPVRIMVTRPVTDRFHQGHTLIPQHSLILGEQEARPQFGQTRIAVKIDELQLPDGTIVSLKGQMADRAGALGASGKVNNHYVKIGVAALLSAALNIGARGAAGDTSSFQPTLEQEFSRDVGQSVNRTGQSIVDRSLQIPPTIILPAGSEITVQLGENVSFAQPPTVSK